MNIEFRQFIPEKHWAWINEQVAIIWCEDTTGIMAVNTDTQKPVGACIMDNWTANSVQCHSVCTSPLIIKYGFVDLCFDFIFNIMGMSSIYGMIPANNIKSVKFHTHLGFTVKAIMEEAYATGVDYLLMEMKRENCLYLSKQAKEVHYG
jgi:hypothetical protein